MGVRSLSPFLKVIGGASICFDGGRNARPLHVIIDGGFLLHRQKKRGEAAYLLVLKNDVSGFVLECQREVGRFEKRGIKVTVVFDGKAPPAKQDTGDTRRTKREEAAELAKELEDKAATRQQVNEAAANGCSFSVRTTARVARGLREGIKGQVYIAPREADPQIVVFQNVALEEGQDVYVYSSDSDLPVLGADKLLHTVEERHGILTGKYVIAQWILQPSSWAFQIDTPQHGFLRQLHGLPKEHDPNLEATALPLGRARERLMAFAMLAGNDYGNFKNIGSVNAATMALRPVLRPLPQHTEASVSADACIGLLSEEVAQHAKSGDTAAARKDAAGKLWKMSCMFRHAVIWDPFTGAARHASNVESSPEMTQHTGRWGL